MSLGEVMEFYGDFLITVAAVVATASVVMHAMVPWTKTSMGRHIMSYLVALAILFDLTFIDNVMLHGPDPLWFEILQLVMFTALPVTMAWRLWIQWQVRPGRRLPVNKEAAMTEDKGSDDGGESERVGEANH